MAADLPREARADLRSVGKDVADLVARHLVMAGRLVDDDPETAYEHARFARRLLPRLAIVREAVGVCAYTRGQWAEALAEFRAAARISGSADFVPLMADCERGLGRPERALALGASAEARRLGPHAAAELRIVLSGARRDLGQVEAAVVELHGPDLEVGRADPWSARLFYAYADALLAAGRVEEARGWFVASAMADADGTTDAQERLEQLDEPATAAASGTPEVVHSSVVVEPATTESADAPDGDISVAEVQQLTLLFEAGERFEVAEQG